MVTADFFIAAGGTGKRDFQPSIFVPFEPYVANEDPTLFVAT